MNLRKDGGKSKPMYVHRLVLEAFKGPCPEGMECAHNDGNPANGMLTNLRWATHADNNQDKVAHGTMIKGELHKLSKLTANAVVSIISDTRLQSDIAKTYGVDPSLINKVKRKVIWRHITAC